VKEYAMSAPEKSHVAGGKGRDRPCSARLHGLSVTTRPVQKENPGDGTLSRFIYGLLT
jgi:hypothetical protein